MHLITKKIVTITLWIAAKLGGIKYMC